MKTMLELMQERGRIQDQMKGLLAKAQQAGRNLTNEEEQEWVALQDQYDSLSAQIDQRRMDDLAARDADLNKPANRPWRPSTVVPGERSQNNQKLDDGGFANLGEFIDAVRFGDPKGRLRSLPQSNGEARATAVPEAFRSQILPGSVRAEWTMGTGSEGGFAVPSQTAGGDPLMLQVEGPIVRPRATVVPAGNPPDAAISMPAFHQGADGILGGVQVRWTGEGDEKPETSGKLREVTLQPHEVSATTVVSDKLLRNWQAADAFISSLLRKAVDHTEDIVALRGDGVAKPLGVANSTGALAVNRALANKISYADVVQMLAKLLPDSTGRAVWVANQSVLPELVSLTDGAGRYIFIQGDATKGIPTTLAGIPIRFTGKTPALGTKGDLMLVDFSYYLLKDGSGPFIAASEHVYFKQNKTVVKVYWNVDGKGWCIEPLLLDDGVTQVSPYVILDIPAA